MAFPIPARAVLPVLLMLAVGACTTIGVHDMEELAAVDFGPREIVRFCVLRAPDVDEDRARRLVAAVDAEFEPYGLDVEVSWMRPWERPGFAMESILADIVPRPLEPPCDRLMALVDRHLGDTVWGLVLPEVLGAVETVTHTKGYAVATMGSINQIASNPSSSAVHEAYHFLGCGHDLVMGECYRRIALIKGLARANRAAGRDFFPGLDPNGKPVTTRRQADTLLRRALNPSASPEP